MYATYVFISVILLIIGIASSVYFVRFLKNTNLLSTGIPALSESLNTIFIGIFYFYCAIVMSQHAANPTTASPMNATEHGLVPNQEITETYNPESVEVTETTQNVWEQTTQIVTTARSSQFPNEEYLLSYQNFLQNAINRNATHKKFKQLNNTEYNSTDCFGQIFMESSMFLYSFLHSVVSLIIGANSSTQNPVKLIRRKREDEEAADETDTKCVKLKLTVKILAILLTPIVCVVGLYFAMDQNVKVNLVTKLLDPSNIESNIWSVIYKPINASTESEKPEINDVVKSVYTIINATKLNTPSPAPDYYVVTKRRPKLTVQCPNFDTIHRIYTVTVFLLYFLAILYAKVKEVKTRTKDEARAKQMNVSIKSFALLWSLGILELFSKTYLFDNNNSNIFREIFLSVANFDQLSITVMNYLAAKETVKRYNLVEPKA